jgi:hypothetical protein
MLEPFQGFTSSDLMGFLGGAKPLAYAGHCDAHASAYELLVAGVFEWGHCLKMGCLRVGIDAFRHAAKVVDVKVWG